MRRRASRAALALLLAAAQAAAAGAEPEPPRRPPPPRPGAPALPAKELAAAAERWKLDKAAERAARPGPTGQHDLFWQVLHLWEKDAPSRADADLRAVVEWLLFTAGLVRDGRLADPVYRKLPGLVPELGARILGMRLESWLAGAGTHSGSQAPWSWPEFPDVDKKVLAGAVRSAAKSDPRNNPVVRFWLAAALAACGAEEGEAELAAAWAAVRKDLPSQSGALASAAASGLAGAGVKAGLGLLQEQAEAELDNLERLGAAGQMPAPPPLMSLQRLLGWHAETIATLGEHRNRLAAVRQALEKGADKLQWDAGAKRFTGLVPPGTERLAAAARALPDRYHLRTDSALAGGREACRQLFAQLVTLMGRDAAAARDPALAELALALLEVARPETDRRLRRQLLVALPAVSRPLGVRCWARFLADRLEAVEPGTLRIADDLLNLDRQLQDLDRTLLPEARKLLLPEMKKAFEAAADQGAGERLKRALAYLYAGGPAAEVKLPELLAAAEQPGGFSRGRGVLANWAQGLVEAGNVEGLHLALADVREDLDRRAAHNAHATALMAFLWLSGLSKERYQPVLARDDETLVRDLAACARWLGASGDKLKWDAKAGRFAPPEGLAPPDLASLRPPGRPAPPPRPPERPAPAPMPDPPEAF